MMRLIEAVSGARPSSCLHSQPGKGGLGLEPLERLPLTLERRPSLERDRERERDSRASAQGDGQESSYLHGDGR